MAAVLESAIDAGYVVYDESNCPAGFTWRSHLLVGGSGYTVTDCLNAQGENPHAYYDRLSGYITVAVPLAIVGLFPGWSKLLAIPVALMMTFPKPTWPDGSPVFRAALYGGL